MKKGKKREQSLESLNPLEKRTVILGVSGDIAAYKALDLAAMLRRSGADVHAIMTAGASNYVTPLALQTMTNNTVYHDHCPTQQDSTTHHSNDNSHAALLELAGKADLILIAPGTADLIAKLANGMCDDMLTTAVLASRARVMVAPAMNPIMWEHPATQNNLSILQNRYRCEIIPPEIGEVANGEFGAGKMASMETIIATAGTKLLTQRGLADKHILITAGGTREPIDPVRFIGNRSSGKMGIAVADAAYARGADVTLISTVEVERSYPVILVETALEMQESVEAEFDGCDALVMTAAVADFRPLAVSSQKIRQSESEDITLELTKNPDIVDLLGQVKRKEQYIIGFAAESEELFSNASSKLKKKNLDLIVANDISVPDIGFGSDDNAVVILSADGSRENLPRMPKRAIADYLCDKIAIHYSKEKLPAR